MPPDRLSSTSTTAVQTLGWVLMGYPSDLPGWWPVYRLGARLNNWRPS